MAIVVIALLFVGVRLFVRPFTVPSTAVSPCLKKGETVILDRGGLLTGKLPRRFEIVAIVPPSIDNQAYSPPQGIETMVADLTGISFAPDTVVDLRRVIALPGETVVARKGLGILIDGKVLEESSYTKDKPDADLFVLADLKQGLEHQDVPSEAPIVVPERALFVLPDNRKEFVGSNKWGFLDRTRLVGTATYKLDGNGLKQIVVPKLIYATEKVAINDNGVRALEKGEYEKAIHLFKESLALDDNFELAQENLSIAYNNFAVQSVDKPDVAMDSLHRALFLDPNNAVTRKNVTGLLSRLGKSATSYQDRIDLGEEALKRGKTITALVEFREALKLRPNAALLARVSQLERKCNFPPHAIPEDEVTAENARAENAMPATHKFSPEETSSRQVTAMTSGTISDSAGHKPVTTTNGSSAPAKKDAERHEPGGSHKEKATKASAGEEEQTSKHVENEQTTKRAATEETAKHIKKDRTATRAATEETVKHAAKSKIHADSQKPPEADHEGTGATTKIPVMHGTEEGATTSQGKQSSSNKKTETGYHMHLQATLDSKAAAVRSEADEPKAAQKAGTIGSIKHFSRTLSKGTDKTAGTHLPVEADHANSGTTHPTVEAPENARTHTEAASVHSTGETSHAKSEDTHSASDSHTKISIAHPSTDSHAKSSSSHPATKQIDNTHPDTQKEMPGAKRMSAPTVSSLSPTMDAVKDAMSETSSSVTLTAETQSKSLVVKTKSAKSNQKERAKVVAKANTQTNTATTEKQEKHETQAIYKPSLPYTRSGTPPPISSSQSMDAGAIIKNILAGFSSIGKPSGTTDGINNQDRTDSQGSISPTDSKDTIENKTDAKNSQVENLMKIKRSR